MSMTLARERLMLTIALFCPSTGGGGGTIDPWYPGSKETLSHLISSEIIHHMSIWDFITFKYIPDLSSQSLTLLHLLSMPIQSPLVQVNSLSLQELRDNTVVYS